MDKQKIIIGLLVIILLVIIGSIVFQSKTNTDTLEFIEKHIKTNTDTLEFIEKHNIDIKQSLKSMYKNLERMSFEIIEESMRQKVEPFDINRGIINNQSDFIEKLYGNGGKDHYKTNIQVALTDLKATLQNV